MVDYIPAPDILDEYYYESGQNFPSTTVEESSLENLRDLTAKDGFMSDDSSAHESADFFIPQTKNYWAVILGLVCIVVVIGNVLVIVSVYKEKVLQNVTNYFIVSLAVADLLVAGCVMPFSVYVLVSHFILDAAFCTR